MSSRSANSPLPPLIANLLAADVCQRGITPTLIETHISWVILVGEHVYKIKKPLDLGFLDFSSLSKRQHFCQEEIRLNRRLAPDVYLATVAITGSPEAPCIEGNGPAIEWAVKMRAFPADATLDREITISTEQIDSIAECIAAFHADLETSSDSTNYGTPAAVIEPVEDNFTQLRKLLPGSHMPLLVKLQNWSQAEGERLAPHFSARKSGGFVRECHGDLHLGNIAWVDGKPLIFDALEFNPALRHIDVFSEIAFLCMDLQHRGRPDLAWRLLDRYLEQTGDIAGIEALHYYLVYRALVRAKVAAILATERSGVTDFSVCLGYLSLAERLAQARRPTLILMHGVSGSGKTWLSQRLLEQLGTIRLRSDVMRKRLFGLKPLQNSSAIDGGIYTPEASRRTLAALVDAAGIALRAGFTVIVDATFIHQVWRAPFAELAATLGIDLRIVALTAAPELLQARIQQRQSHADDASEAGIDVLASQLEHQDPFTAQEESRLIRLDAADTSDKALSAIRTAFENAYAA